MLHYEEKDIKLYHGDALEVMGELAEEGYVFDAIIVDPPYGTLKKPKWDSIIPLPDMWNRIKLIRKENTPAIIFGQAPFDKILGASNIKELRYEWIYEKTQATGHFNANKMPMKAHENILVFYKKLPTYNPQKTYGHKPVNSFTKKIEVADKSEIYGKNTQDIIGGGNTDRYPRSVIKFKSDKQKNKLHPTQKPEALIEYLIKTYTNEGDLILDFAMGSGTTPAMCKKLNRRCIGIEIDLEYCEVSKNRVKAIKV